MATRLRARRIQVPQVRQIPVPQIVDVPIEQVVHVPVQVPQVQTVERQVPAVIRLLRLESEGSGRVRIS